MHAWFSREESYVWHVCMPPTYISSIMKLSISSFLQQFGIQLAAHVIEQYPLPDAMGIAKDIFKRLMVLSNEIPASLREGYFLPLLPSVVKLSKTFPPLCKEATEFLVHLCKTCGASLSSKSVGISSLDVTADSSNVFETFFIAGETGRINKAIQKAFEEIVNNAVVHL